MITKENSIIGFIGTGVMGKSMASNLLHKGFRVVVYSRTKAKAEELIASGAQWVDTPKEIAEKANVVITIVGFPSDVEEVYFGENGLIPNGKKKYIFNRYDDF